MALAALSFLLTLSLPLFNTLIKMEQYSQNIYLYQDEIGIYQMQLQLARNNITAVDPQQIVYNSSESECTISLVNNNVISQPGYLCYLIDVDDIYFYKKFFIVYLEYTRKGMTYTCPIAYEY
ncbi:MAG: hypothetical protein ACI4WG_06325 [Erysipelotrichaceae bacterium]